MPINEDPSIGIVLRCHRDPLLVARLVELVRRHVDEVVIVADERMSPEDLGAIALAQPTSIHRIPHVQPNERANSFAYSLCSCDWLLRLCGDELPSQELLQNLRSLITDRRVTHYRTPIAWLWPECHSRLDEFPWWPDHQVRLLRNDPALFYVPGTTHGGLKAIGPYRLLAAPVFHLDLLITSEKEREEKAARYEVENPGLLAKARPLNEVLYFPNKASPSPATKMIGEHDAALVKSLIAQPAAQVQAEELLLPVHDVESVDALWNSRPWPAEAYRAKISPAQSKRDFRLSVGNNFIQLAVENLGPATWPSGIAPWPHIRVSYRPWSEKGSLIYDHGRKTSFPSAVGPGEKVLIAARVELPNPGRFIAEFDLMFEPNRWFNCPLRVELQATGAGSQSQRRWRMRIQPWLNRLLR
jgi:hypothetical protein